LGTRYSGALGTAGHGFAEHTADCACEVWAPTFAGLLAEAGRAFTDAITPIEGVEAREEHRLAVAAGAPDELLVAWLEELLYLFETTDVLVCGAKVRVDEAGGELRLTATVAGEPFDGERHPLRTLIKGVTYHDLTVEERSDGWRARVLFDI